MLKINTILAPVDFSEYTETQGEAAVNLARHFDSKVVLLHVIPMFSYPHPADPTAAKAYEHKFEAEIRGGVEQALTGDGRQTEPRVRSRLCRAKGRSVGADLLRSQTVSGRFGGPAHGWTGRFPAVVNWLGHAQSVA
ncbi:MAG: universal stress protein [Bryobacterales bacterium]